MFDAAKREGIRMYTLHIANKNYSSWSLRPWLLMRMLAIPFEERLTPFPTGSSWSLFRPFSPNGRVPCLIDDGWAVWDSLAIAEYLAERHAGVWPSDARARAWARSAAAEMHSSFTALRNACPMSCGVRVQPHPILRVAETRPIPVWAICGMTASPASAGRTSRETASPRSTRSSPRWRSASSPLD